MRENDKNDRYYTTYIKAKNVQKPVSLLIPMTSEPLLRFLLDLRKREEAGIFLSNDYVFPSKRLQNHVSAYEMFHVRI